MAIPRVTIVVLNWNGRRFLDGCLSSLGALRYPADCYQVVVVDNGSSDDSLALLAARYPWVRVFRCGKNLGFARGNNRGIRGTTSDYVVLLNNDTIVEPAWLAGLVDAAERDASVGLCTSKILLEQRRLELTLRVDSSSAPHTGDGEGQLGVRVAERAEVDGTPVQVEYLDGFGNAGTDGANRFRWGTLKASLGLPTSADHADRCCLVMGGARSIPHEARCVSVLCGDAVVGSFEVGHLLGDYQLALPPLTAIRPVVQNAGTLLLANGMARDRGAVVRGCEQYYECDRGQYDDEEEVFAGCGASLLLRRAMLDDVGLLDESFFMYYEDVDLSWRARLRGWKVMYVPKSVVHHVHCGSSQEWSPFFTYHVERNWLAMLLKNAPVKLALDALSAYTRSTLRAYASLARPLVRGRTPAPARARALASSRVIADLGLSLPGLLLARRRIQRHRRVGPQAIARWMVGA